ncbi:MAG: citramalate synthase, partial [Promethearchaeota archaeon]
LSTMDFKNARICAFGMTRRPMTDVENDDSIRALLKAGTPVVTIVGKAWDLHVQKVLRTTLDENLSMIKDSIKYFKNLGKEVIFDAEHFFDAYLNNPDYAIRVLKTADDVGADWVVLCDTNGGMLPFDIERVLTAVRESIKAPLGIHCHNDSGVAVANSLVAVKLGVSQVHGTIDGLGERCGNANLTTIIPNLKLKMGFDNLVTDSQLKSLKETSLFIREAANLNDDPSQPYVGFNAFAHKGGMHSNAIIKDATTYEHIDPALVGNERRISISDLAGRTAIYEKAREFGLNLDKNDPVTINLLDKIKSLQKEGFTFESAEGSLELLMKSVSHNLQDPSELKSKFFTLERFKVITEASSELDEPRSEAIIKIRVNEREFLTAAEGNGPVNALDNALRKSLEYFYPEIRNIELTDYKVRITDQAGTGSKVRVLIETKDKAKEMIWVTVGASENILWASWLALEDSIVYKLLKELEGKGFRLG